MQGRWKAACVAVVLFAGVFALTVKVKAACSAGCHLSDCWKVNGTCWKVEQTCCDGFGAQALSVGGTKNKTGSYTARENTACTAECPMATDSKASCTGTQGTGTWPVDKCTCDS